MTGSSPTIENCIFSDNLGTMAGGVLVVEAAPTLIGCTFRDNIAGAGGGGFTAMDDSHPTLIQCMFVGNEGANGGGVYCEDGCYPYLEGCTFLDNGSPGRGGGVRCDNSYPTISQCTLVGNGAQQASAIFLTGGDGVIENTIVAFNLGGGAIGCALEATIAIACSDVYGNSGGDWIGCIYGQEGVNGNICLDPLFCGDARPEEPYTLDSDSPCAPDYNPECGLVGAWPVRCGAATTAEPLSRRGGPRLSLAAPNPFSVATRITYTIESTLGAEPVRLRIFDPTGRLVRTLVDRVAAPGIRHAVWDGSDSAGMPCWGGVYFYRLDVGGQQRVQRVTLLR